MDAKSNILCLYQPVVSFCKLHFQHIRIFLPDVVKIILPKGNIYRLYILFKVNLLVKERDLELDGAVEVIQELTVILENCGLVIVLCQLVINIEKLNGLGEEPILHLADTVPEDFLIRDTLLGSLGNLLLLLICLQLP